MKRFFQKRRQKWKPSKDGAALIGPAVTVKEVTGALDAHTIDDFKIGIVIDLEPGL